MEEANRIFFFLLFTRYRFLKVLFFILFYLIFCIFRAAPTAYGGSQARGRFRAVATGPHHSRSNTRSEPSL